MEDIKEKSADEKKYLIKNNQNLILTKQESENCYNFSSVGLEDLKNYTRGIKETQDIIADFYNYLTRFEVCDELRIEDILQIVEYEEYIKGW